MKNFILLIVLLAVATAVASQPLIAPRLIGGIPIDTLRRFPHHVTIEKSASYDGKRSICGGSILNARWILTSALCVDNSATLQLHFERLYLNHTIGSYTLVVNSDAVYIYPTYYDDIALVKLPVQLIFSDLIKPVTLTQSVSQTANKLAVLPGFDVNVLGNTIITDQLTYVMLTLVSNNKCTQYYPSGHFDEYLQLCTTGNAKADGPCVTDFGSGLLTGWPARSELIGIYSGTSYDCSIDAPAVYTNVVKYKSWIESLINT